MVRNFLYITLILLFFHPFNGFSQEDPQVSLNPWTTKAGQKGTYYKMLNWDTSPYKEFTYLKRTGPNPWEITEYLNFRMLYPNGYDSLVKDGKSYPLIIFLHGSGESGIKWTGHFDYANGYGDSPPEPEKIANNDHQLRFGGKEFLAARNRPEDDPRAFNGFFLFPQIPYNGAWAGNFESPTTEYNRQVIELVDILISKYKVDPNKVYIMGLSNGARGVWDLIYRRPDLFAAAIVFSGIGDQGLMSQKLAHLPIWIFQGGKDDNPTPSATNQMINAMEEEGGSPRLTVYEDLEHGVWNKAFTEPDFFSWLLSNSKTSIHVYYGKTHFETIDNIEVKLGISPGFLNYQWKYNGEIIENATNNNLIAKAPGFYQVRFQRDDSWTSWSEPVLITSDENEIIDLPMVYRVNVGGKTIQDTSLDWEMDNNKNPSPHLHKSTNETVFTYDKPFQGNFTGIPDEIFMSGRILSDKVDPLQYKFPIKGGTTVNLYFTLPSYDQYENILGKIKVQIEGDQVKDSLEIMENGALNALKESYAVLISDDTLNITIEGLAGTPVLSGIEIKGDNTITGVDKKGDHPKVLAYPNPVLDELNVVLPNDHSVESLSLSDLSGNLIYFKSNIRGESLLNLSSLTSQLPSGLYILQINFMNRDHKTLKIVKK